MRNHSSEVIEEYNRYESPSDNIHSTVIKVAEMSLRHANLKFYKAVMNGDLRNLEYFDNQAEMAGLEVIDALHAAGKDI